jgi:hypothetical protein
MNGSAPGRFDTLPVMERDRIIERAFTVFQNVERPAHFTNFNHCCECREHDEVLLAGTPATISRSDLGTMAWDPITFTTGTGFRYYIPGLIRVVLTQTGDNNYYEQFLWHMASPDQVKERCPEITEEECEVISETLEYLLNHRTTEIDEECMADTLLAAVESWT